MQKLIASDLGSWLANIKDTTSNYGHGSAVLHYRSFTHEPQSDSCKAENRRASGKQEL